MPNESDDAGIIAVLIERYETQRLPRVIDLKTRVDRGETLGESDIHFLNTVFQDIQNAGPLIERHPECQKLAAHMLTLCEDICSIALQNQRLTD